MQNHDPQTWELGIREINASQNGIYCMVFQMHEDAKRKLLPDKMSHRRLMLDLEAEILQYQDYEKHDVKDYKSQTGIVDIVKAKRYDLKKMGISFYAYSLDDCYVVEFSNEIPH